ncbi:MAG: AAA domain-containing protein, partial [Candidatus Paracaedibacteraceae bacterium]|nr:AAA domain-containing protein [Candidatus Paracaedibacteraceae bacterium]
MTKQPITNLNNHFEKILKYWSVIETLNPQGPSKITTDEYVRNYTVKADADSLPWNHTHEHQTVSVTERTKWVYTLYAGELSLTDSYATIVNAFQEFPSQNNNKSKETFSLFSVCVDHFGRLMSDSILISSYAWALGKIEESGKESYKDLDAFTDEEEHIQRDLKDFLNATFSANSMISSETNAQRKLSPEILEPVTPDQLFTLYNFLCDKLKLSRLKEDRTIMIRASMFSDESGAPDTSGLLNSFFLNDLQQLQEESKANNLSEAAMQYLAASIDTNTRIDIRQTSAAFMDVFTPDHYPRGCWPNTGNHPLVFSQQFAVNSFFKECLSKDGLFSVNGPPGTGKTTLLRDVIANVIVERACYLAQLETPSGAFKRSTIKKADGKESDIYELDSALHGFEIVVTSSNNAAVENITLEIPGIDAVDPSTLGNCDYFRPWAERLLKDKAWGMVAGRLGNKSNRDTFIKDFWLDLEVQDDQYINLSKAILDKKDDGKGFDGFLKAHSATIFGATADNDESTTSENQTKSWKDSVADFNQALATEHVFCKARQAVFEIYQKMIVLRSEYITLKRAMLQNPENEHNETTKRLSEIQAAIITFKETIPKDFDHTLVPHFIKQNNVDIDAQELSSPWMDQDWYQARVNVFQAALNLHKKFVLSNARIFRWNLRQF